MALRIGQRAETVGNGADLHAADSGLDRQRPRRGVGERCAPRRPLAGRRAQPAELAVVCSRLLFVPVTRAWCAPRAVRYYHAPARRRPADSRHRNTMPRSRRRRQHGCLWPLGSRGGLCARHGLGCGAGAGRRARPGSAGPPRFPAQQRPPEDPQVVARGKRVYDISCRACHGADLRGGDMGGPTCFVRSRAERPAR